MNQSRTPTLVIFGIFTVITIMVWIGFEVFRSFTVEPEPDIPRAITLPLNPNLDIEALNEIQTRIELTDSEIGEIQLATPTPQPTPTETLEDEDLGFTEEELLLLEEELEEQATEEGIINEGI